MNRDDARVDKFGGASRFSDLYHCIMEMSWPAFIALVTLTYVLVNLAFGLIYAAVPGAIANVRPYSLLDGFFFSVDTLGTVGYGSMAPKSPVGHFIATFEILAGLFFSATITGLIFARFARPRDSIIFSKVAVIGLYDDRPALMVRVASTRSRPLADSSAQISWLERIERTDGRIIRRLVELPLLRSNNPVFGVLWTLVHFLEADSPFIAAFENYAMFSLTVSVRGHDTLLASQTTSCHEYDKSAILKDHEYLDVFCEVDGVVHVNLLNFDLAEPLREPCYSG